MTYISPLFAVITAMFFVPPAAAQSEAETQVAQELYIPEARLAPINNAMAQRGIQLVYVAQDATPGNGKYFCGALAGKQLEYAIATAQNSLNKIPSSAWDNINLKYILLCDRAKAGDRTIGGIPVPPLKLLMVSAGMPSQSSRFATTILHELYHLIEFQDNSYNDAQWDEQFKGYDNSYGKTSGSTALGSGGEGFINGYGKSFPHEERAEIFALLHMHANRLTAYLTTRNDPVLAAKLQYINAKCKKILGADACL